MDGNNYNQGTADYEVAMADMLLHGFPIGGNANNMFPALRSDQVMIGLPAAPAAAPSGGYISPTEMKKALDYIIKGIPFGGKYKLSNQSGYPAFRGLMSWSINWDAKTTLNSLITIEHISMRFPCKNNKNNNRFYMTYCCFYLYKLLFHFYMMKRFFSISYITIYTA